MDLKKYIESGILEQYVLGLLSTEDQAIVEEHLAKYPEIREEVHQIEQTLESYISLHKKPCPPGLEDRILEKIKNTPNDLPPPPQAPPASSGSKWPLILLAIAALSGLLLAGYFTAQNQQKADRISTLENELIAVQNDCDQKDQTIADLQQQLQIIRDTDNALIHMKGTPKAPQAIAAIYWNEHTHKTYLDVLNLPTPPSDKQYQLWAIVDGNPVDMGVFDIVVGSLQEVPFIEHPQAFAVTLEKKGGNPTPTLEEMVVIGNI